MKTTDQLKTISIIIPVFNEQAYIRHALDKIISADTCRLKKELVIINDGSTDQTSLEVLRFIKKHRSKRNIKFQFINKKNNQGKGAALKIGLLKSRGDVVLIQDADLEYNPDDYPVLLEPILLHHADVVYGSRFISQKPHRVLYFWHSIGNAFLTLFSNMCTNLNLTDMETGYKVFRGQIIRKLAIKLKSPRFGFEPEVTARLAKIPNITIYEVGITYRGRTYEEGKKIGWRDGVHAIFQIIRYNWFS